MPGLPSSTSGRCSKRTVALTTSASLPAKRTASTKAGSSPIQTPLSGWTRRSWFAVPCCPYNLSRTWASLGKYVYSFDENNIWVHQYIGGKATEDDGRWTVSMESGLPWDGKVRIRLAPEQPAEFTLHLRIPSWAVNPSVCINGETQLIPSHPLLVTHFSPTASGYDPRLSQFLPIRRVWSSGDIVELEFEMPITLRRASPRVRGHKGKVALTRGPLVYCLESVDNPNVNIFSARLDVIGHALSVTYSPPCWAGRKAYVPEPRMARL
jgi:DUF1680 family protein